jgi:hypothetical protein
MLIQSNRTTHDLGRHRMSDSKGDGTPPARSGIRPILCLVPLVLILACFLGTWSLEPAFGGGGRWRSRCARSRRCGADCCTCTSPRFSANALPPGTVETKTFVSPKGRWYLLHITNVREADEQLQQLPKRVVAEAIAADRRLSDGDLFVGKDRKAAKLSISGAQPENFASLSNLFGTLASDDDIAQDPNISEDPSSLRVGREDRNVIVNARLYASSKESDNDFHCIIGGVTPDGDVQYINAEISGLPDSQQPSFAQLSSARQQFKDYFGQDLPGHRYSVWPDGIPVRVSGSLFFDLHHYRQGDQAGTGGYKAPTYWEIHPITNIEFEPQ